MSIHSGGLALWRRGRDSAMLFGAMGTVVRLGANIILLPLVIGKLSAPDLALWWVLLALGNVATLADFGFATAIARVYSYLWAGADDFDTEGLRPLGAKPEPNRVRLRELNVTVRQLYRHIGIGAGLVLLLVGSIFIIRPARLSPDPWTVWVAWVAYVVTIAYSIGSSHWVVACQGTNRVRNLQAAFMWSGLIYLVVAAVLLEAGLGLMSLVFATAVKAWIGRVLTEDAYHQAVPDLPDSTPKTDPTIFRRLWPNARKFGVLSLGAYLIFNSGVLISSHYLGNTTTAAYGLTTQIGLFLANFSSLWLTVKWPEITILRAQGRSREMAAVFARRLTWSLITFGVLAALTVLLGDYLLAWKGAHTRLLPVSYLMVYLFYIGQQQLYVQFGTLTFTENTVPFFWISLWTGVGLVVLSVVLTAVWGLWGLVLGPLIATLACSSWYPVWRGFRGQPLTVPEFLRAAVTGRA